MGEKPMVPYSNDAITEPMHVLNPHADDSLARAIAAVPAGAWAVGVSGGADSVALLSMLRTVPGMRLHVTHLNHETRGIESDADADFVHQLAEARGLPYSIHRLSDITPRLARVPNNPSARYRAARFELFRTIVNDEHLDGVILAHHANDQAETILQRLLRGSGVSGLRGIQPRMQFGELLVLHPLLAVSRLTLRQWLARHQIAWREDASNHSSHYLRNRLRAAIQPHAELHAVLIGLVNACSRLNDAFDQAAPRLADKFPTSQLSQLPEVLAHHAARRWLRERGVDSKDLGPASTADLVQMARDAASPPRRHFPGGLLVHRRKGIIFIEPEFPIPRN